jgi:spermidine synthase
MNPWQTLETAAAPDGKPVELRRRGHEFLIRADGLDLMSSDDNGSSKALASLGLAALGRPATRVLVGGLGMGFTLRAALDLVGPSTQVEVAELVAAVAEWNAGPLGDVAGRPLDDPRASVYVGDVRDRMTAKAGPWDAILLDVDNGPDALAHAGNDRIYDASGLGRAHAALRPGGVLAVWSFSDDPAFTKRCRRAGFTTTVERVSASRRGRGRYHFIWVATKVARR